VLHDWSDEVCVKILQNIATAITDKVSQRAVIAENIIPSKNRILGSRPLGRI
jgi:hypothetical protein